MAGVLFLIGMILFVLAVVAFFRPMPKLRLGTRKAASVALALSLGSCVAGGLLAPQVPTEPQVPTDQSMPPSTKDAGGSDEVKPKRSTAPGLIPGSEAARVMDNLARTAASPEQRAELERDRAPQALAAAWRGLPDLALPDCRRFGDQDLMCVTSQQEIISTWPAAWGGDYQAQRNIAYCLKTTCDGALVQNLIQTCAWRAVIATSGSPLVDGIDADNLEQDCGGLRDSERVVALAQAERIAAALD